MLAAGLMFGAGGAIASAEPDSDGGASSGSAGASQGSTANDQGADASDATAGSATNTQSKTGPRVTLRIPKLTGLAPSRLSPNRPGVFTRPTSIVRGGVDTRASKDTESEDRKPVATETQTAPAVDSGTATAGESGTTTTAESGTATTVESGTSTAVGSQTPPAAEGPATETALGTETSVQTVPADGSAAPSNPEPAGASVTAQTERAPAPTVDPVAAMSNTTGPLTDPFGKALVTINGAVTTWSESLVALPTSATPVRDAVISLQTMLTTVVDAVSGVPGDVYAMLGIPASANPPQSLVGGSGSLVAGGVSSPIEGPFVGPHVAEPPYTVGPADGSLFGAMTPPVLDTVAGTNIVQPLSVSGTVPMTTGVAPVNAKSIFEHVIEAVLVPASLTALAAVALPGVGALLVVAAAGVRVGYRQAKAGLALRASGLARFAGPGPLGIARSASMVALRQRARGPRTKRAVCPDAARAAHNLERVA